MINGAKTIPEFDNYHKLPYSSQKFVNQFNNSSDSISLESEGSEEIEFDKFSYFPDKFSHYSDKVIKLNKEGILSYYISNKKLRIIEKPDFDTLDLQKNSYVVETEVKQQIADYKILKNGRVIVVGKHGFVGIYNYKNMNELLEYYDIPIEEFREDWKEITAFDIDLDSEEYIVIAGITIKKENFLCYFKVHQKEGIFKYDSVYRVNSTPFYSVKIGMKIGVFRIVSVITEGEPFKAYFYTFGDNILVSIGDADLKYVSCYDQIFDSENGVISYGGIFDKIQMIKIETAN